MDERTGPLGRILKDSGARDMVEVLTDMSGTDLNTLLLEVMRRRAKGASPAELLRAYDDNRFVGPAGVPWAALRRAEDAVLAVLPESFELCDLSPVVPVGTNSALAPVDQNNVVSSLRGGEVVADPTSALALEAAWRRRRLLDVDPRSAQPVRLASSHRVVRAQRFDDPALVAHFRLLGVVTAGRDTGNRAFEKTAAVEHLRLTVDACLATGAQAVRLDLTDLTGGDLAVVTARVTEEFEAVPHVTVALWPDRPRGRVYYDGFCFNVRATYDGATLEVGDGGLVDWTKRLLANAKERLFTSGLALERMADAEAVVNEEP